MKVFLAIPCYNCKDQLARVVQDLLQNKTLLNCFDIVAIIDNKSEDDTVLETLKQLEESSVSKVKIYTNHRNYGLGGSHKVAFRLAQEASCDFLAILHGDHQANTGELLDLMQLSKKNNRATVLGARFLSDSKLIGYSTVRTAGNRFLNWVYSLLTGTTISDLGSGINIFNLSHFNQTEFNSFSDDFTFNMDLLLHLVGKKKNFIFCPIEWKSEDEISNAKIVKVGIASLKKVFAWRLNFPVGNPATNIPYEADQVR